MFRVNRRYIADFDWPLFSLALGMAVFGVLEISSVEPSPEPYATPRKPLRTTCTGIAWSLSIISVTSASSG